MRLSAYMTETTRVMTVPHAAAVATSVKFCKAGLHISLLHGGERMSLRQEGCRPS